MADISRRSIVAAWRQQAGPLVKLAAAVTAFSGVTRARSFPRKHLSKDWQGADLQRGQHL